MNPPNVSVLPARQAVPVFRSRIPTTTADEEVSLSRYFPAGTEYFYGYPAGQDSRFYNVVTPVIEELVAARALVCSGEHVHPVVFASTLDAAIFSFLRDDLGVTVAPRERIKSLPSHITSMVKEEETRNVLLKSALRMIGTSGQLVMAQPYLDPSLEASFQFPPEIAVWLNDKMCLPDIIPGEFLPECHAIFLNGTAFAQTREKIPVPCVVKVASSCCGYGVRICHTREQLNAAREEYRFIKSLILVQEYLDVARNFSVQFGIPHDEDAPVEIIGISEQLTTPEGEFIGGIVDPQRLLPQVDGVNDLLLWTVLPGIRDNGWYGVGGFDVLVDRRGRFFITDPNFRMTGMTPYLCAARNGTVSKRMVSFTGSFRGSLPEFRKMSIPIARAGDSNQCIHMIALMRERGVYWMSGAMLFSEDWEAPAIARKLIRMGIESKVLSKLERNGRDHYPDFSTGT